MSQFIFHGLGAIETCLNSAVGKGNLKMSHFCYSRPILLFLLIVSSVSFGLERSTGQFDESSSTRSDSFLRRQLLPSYQFTSPIGSDSYQVRVGIVDEKMIYIEFLPRRDTKKSFEFSPMVEASFIADHHITPVSQDLLMNSRLGIRREKNNCVVIDQPTSGRIYAEICLDENRFVEKWRRLMIRSPHTENIYGLGQYFDQPGNMDGDWVGRQWDPLFHSQGNSMRPFNGGLTGYTMIPVMYSLSIGKEMNYGLFFDSTDKQMWSFKENPWWVSHGNDRFGMFLFVGDSLQDLRRTYMNLTGKPPMPPKNILGLWISEFGYDNWQELENELAVLKENNFPIDGFVLDLQWFGGRFFPKGSDPYESKMGKLSFDRQAFPEPEKVVARMKNHDGIELMLIEESYISQSIKEHDELESRNFLAIDCQSGKPTFLDQNTWWGVGGMVDWINPNAGDFWHRYKRKKLVDMGIRFHWTDLGEPEMYDVKSCYFSDSESGPYPHKKIHNIYNFKWAESIHRGYRNQESSRRHFILSRSGTAGIQRFGVGMWSGDIGGNFSSLRSQMKAQMHISLSGIDYYGSDIGGFHRKDKDTLDELYTQWFAISSLIDFPVRPHTWNVENNHDTSPAKIGHLPSNLFNIRLRYQLSPYYYSLAYQAFKNGDPIIPPLVYYFQEDKRVRTIANQKMIGPWLMMAAISEKDPQSRQIYLPKGKWTNFYNHEQKVSMGGHFTQSVWEDKIFRIPLYVREGAIIPMMSVDQHTGNIYGFRRNGSKNKQSVVRIYPSRRLTSFSWYEDDGNTLGYQNGEFSLSSLSQQQNDNGVEVQVEAREGNFIGQKKMIPLIIQLITDPNTIKKIVLDGKEIGKCGRKIDLETCYIKYSHYLVIQGSLFLSGEKSHIVSFLR